jgi:hypothetical protein
MVDGSGSPVRDLRVRGARLSLVAARTTKRFGRGVSLSAMRAVTRGSYDNV